MQGQTKKEYKIKALFKIQAQLQATISFFYYYINYLWFLYWQPREKKIKYSFFTYLYTPKHTQNFLFYYEHTNDRNWKTFLNYQGYIEIFKIDLEGSTSMKIGFQRVVQTYLWEEADRKVTTKMLGMLRCSVKNLLREQQALELHNSVRKIKQIQIRRRKDLVVLADNTSNLSQKYTRATNS